MGEHEIICPDCRKGILQSGRFDSDEVEDGYCMFCETCGFQIAGRDEAQIRSASLVLERWSAVDGGDKRLAK